MTNQTVSPFFTAVPALAVLGLALLAGAHASESGPVESTSGVVEDAGIRFGARLDRSAVHANGGTVRVELQVESLEIPTRRGADLVVVLDQSGSMDNGKLDDAKSAVRGLVQALGPDDRLALVAYSGQAQVVWPLGSRGAAQEYLGRLDGLSARGSTNLADGIDLGGSLLEVNGRPRRMLLISDGHPTVGETDEPSLVGRTTALGRSEIVVSTIGVGADFNEGLMSQLADSGTGNFYFADTTPLPTIFTAELGEGAATVATGLELDWTLPEGVELVSAGGLPHTVSGPGHHQLRLGSLVAGQDRRVWVTLRVDGDAGPLDLGAPTLRHGDQVWQTHALGVELTEDQQLATQSLDGDTWGRSVVQEEYNTLRQRVSDAVREGRDQEAQQLISTYESRNRVLNEVYDNNAVWDNLAEVDQLRSSLAEIDDGESRSVWSKQQSSSAQRARRQMAR